MTLEFCIECRVWGFGMGIFFSRFLPTKPWEQTMVLTYHGLVGQAVHRHGTGAGSLALRGRDMRLKGPIWTCRCHWSLLGLLRLLLENPVKIFDPKNETPSKLQKLLNLGDWGE